MKILFSSYVFSPKVGGIETVSALLAAEFIRAGHEVILVTRTREDDALVRTFQVVRAPRPAQLIGLVRWCDIFFQNNISLALAWPLLLIGRPWVVAHQVWLNHALPSGSVKPRLKSFLLRYAENISISRAIAEALPVPSRVVGNPYATDVFRLCPEIDRSRELIYLGRLVSDKGVDLLLAALGELGRRGVRPKLTIVGSGPEKSFLEAMIAELQLGDQIEFVGSRCGEELTRILNAHRIMVVPSRWAEPFGLVALEGIACGCGIVAAEVGGLPEAVGPCGVFFKAGDAVALADALQAALHDLQFREKVQAEAAIHLARFTPGEVAAHYLRLFDDVLRQHRGVL